jgi:phage I-like protein
MGNEWLGKLASGQELARFVCEIEPCSEEDAKKPRWIHILPPGKDVEARDGRKFRVESHADIIKNTELPLLIDWEHNSETNGDTRAAGWVEQLKVEPESAGDRAGIWGLADWTPPGREHTSSRHYRFLSPVVTGKRDLQTKLFHVHGLRSVALTNRPALRMHGIESFCEQLSLRSGPFEAETEDMDKFKAALCTAFGLAADASEDALLAAAKPIIDAAKQGNGETASLREAVTKLTSELSAERTAKATLSTELESFREKTRKVAVEAFFDKGSREGKIPPSSRKQWLKFCQESEANFKLFSETIYPGLAPLGDKVPPPPKGKKEKLSARSNPHRVDRAALKAMGFSDEQILESEREVFTANRGRDNADEPDEEDEDEDEDDSTDADEDGDGEEASAP